MASSPLHPRQQRMARLFFLFFLAVSTGTGSLLSTPDVINLRPKQQIDREAAVEHVFNGQHADGQPEHFKLLTLQAQHLMVGARDVVYNLSISDLAEQQRLDWPASEADVASCLTKGKQAADCHNYIRVMAAQADGRTLICGTNAFKPTCRQYAQSMHHGVQAYQMLRQFDGYAISPYDPEHNSTAILVRQDGNDEIYAGTVTDLRGSDPLIYRQTLGFETRGQEASAVLRTRRDDRNTLNNPDFVGSMTAGDYVYFWFREPALEFVSYESSAPPVYARVGRVCRRDAGGPSPFADVWTSFLKARLACRLPGQADFEFNELQSVSPLTRDSTGQDVVYGVFASGANALRMSAVCAFRLHDIDQVFDQGAFLLTPASRRAAWMPVMPKHVPKHRPGKCHRNSRSLNEQTVSFIQRNMLMAEMVPQQHTHPLIVDNTMKTEYTQVTVQPSVRAVNGQLYELVYVGTRDGRVLKLVRTSLGQPVLIESIRALAEQDPVKNLLVSSGRVVVVGSQQVVTVGTARCPVQQTCGACVRLQDPHCAWSRSTHACVNIHTHDVSLDELVQSVDTGKSPVCPESDIDPAMYAVNDVYVAGASYVPGNLHSMESADGSGNRGGYTVAIVLTLCLSLTIGFLVGFGLFHWRQRQQHQPHKTPGNGTNSAASSTISSCDYESSSLSRQRLTSAALLAGKLPNSPSLHPLPPCLMTDSTNVYALPPTSNGMVIQQPTSPIMSNHHNHNLMTASMTLSRHQQQPLQQQPRTHAAMFTSIGTLPRDYKVKREYV